MLFVAFPFSTLSLPLIFVSLITMSCGTFFPGFTMPGTVYFLDWCDCFLYHLWEVFSYFPFNYFLFSFWDPYKVNVFVLTVVPEVSQTVLISFKSLSSFCSIADFHHSVISSLIHSASVTLLLISYSAYFYFIYYVVHLFVPQVLYIFVKPFLYSLNLCLHSFSKILNHLYSHYSEFSSLFFGRLLSLFHLAVLLGFYLVPSSETKNILYFHFDLISVIVVFAPQTTGLYSSCFWCLPHGV